MAKARSVGFVAASGYLPDPEVIDGAAQFFSGRGWRVQASETCFERMQRFAGPDALRATEWQRFCTDKTLDVIVAARGGYGFSRILDQLDYAAMRKTGRKIVGYSDVTAFNLAYLAQAGGVSYQGPSAGDFGAAEPEPFTVEHFFGAIEHEAYAVEFQTEGPDCSARGRLWGGNLAMVCALLATPFFPKLRGGLLFLEDVNEPAYKIERMLLQLYHAGVLQRQKALLLGAFDPLTPMPNDNGFDLAAVVNRLRSLLPIPVFTQLPFGHVPRKLTLPVGAPARLAVKDGQAQLDWRIPPNPSSPR